VVAAEIAEGEPAALYQRLRAVEAAFGRQRRERWGARTLDLDLLALEGAAGAFGVITLPHKRLHERAFVLLPLREVAPGWRHPVLGWTVEDMLAGLPPGETAVRLGRLG
jgi:2-amino-4-hydroxy-6-hydroxymethyldihydropteridine diphosphokinase